MLTEPEAAAIHYAATEHIDPGQIVAVYDLGGGTFDAALLRRRRGPPAEGAAATAAPASRSSAGRRASTAWAASTSTRRCWPTSTASWAARSTRSTSTDPAVAAGLARLRADCVEAKEVLSTDTDVEIPVLLPGLRTEVRMTRGELEAMIRPALGDTIGALRRAMGSAAVRPDEIARRAAGRRVVPHPVGGPPRRLRAGRARWPSTCTPSTPSPSARRWRRRSRRSEPAAPRRARLPRLRRAAAASPAQPAGAAAAVARATAAPTRRDRRRSPRGGRGRGRRSAGSTPCRPAGPAARGRPPAPPDATGTAPTPPEPAGSGPRRTAKFAYRDCWSGSSSLSWE